MSNKIRFAVALGLCALPVVVSAQVPDVLSALDAGGRVMGMGGAGYVTEADTLSGSKNPAGLGYVDKTQVGLALRSLPETFTSVTGPFAPISDQQFDTTGKTGPWGLSHAGVAMPLRSKSGVSKGTVSLGVTLAGFVHDLRFAQNMSNGALTVRNYSELLKARTDLVTLSYGRTNDAQDFNWGAGLVYATTGLLDIRRGTLVDGSNNTVGTVDSDVVDTGTGIGLVAGVQYVPKNQRNSIYGLSVQTPIDLNGNSSSNDIFDRVPGRITLGFATRRDGFRGGRDFLVFGAELEHLFGGGPSPFGGTRKSQTNVGLGFEYTYQAAWGRVPVRVGYAWAPAAGDRFGDRNALMYGFGYRPNGSNLQLDVNWGDPDTGGRDLSFSLSYKVKK